MNYEVTQIIGIKTTFKNFGNVKLISFFDNYCEKGKPYKTLLSVAFLLRFPFSLLQNY